MLASHRDSPWNCEEGLSLYINSVREVFRKLPRKQERHCKIAPNHRVEAERIKIGRNYKSELLLATSVKTTNLWPPDLIYIHSKHN